MWGPLQPGALFLEKYRIERLIGQGGMGAVYAAMDVDLARRVAIKVLLPGAVNTPQAESRFIQEARAAARIEGEHVARVFTAGHAPDGPAYMVLELLEGADLRAVLKKCGRLPLDEAVDIILEALEAISEAHHHGIVHRDLKPENLFLAHRSNGTKLVKVLDFGISKTTNPFAPSESDHALTSTRALLGSPLYMAPEQLRNAKNVDHRADIWSLGVILYEALTGCRPFHGETLGELLAGIFDGNSRLVERQRPELPAKLETVIHRCLEQDPRRRFDDALHLARALTPFGSRSNTSVDRIRRFALPVRRDRSTVKRAAKRAAQPQRGWPLFLLAIPVAFIVGGCILVFFLFVRPKADGPVAAASPACAEPPSLPASVVASAAESSVAPALPSLAAVQSNARQEALVAPKQRLKRVSEPRTQDPAVEVETPTEAEVSFDPARATRK